MSREALRLKRLQHFLRMPCRLNLGEDLLDFAVLVDHKSGARDPHHLLAVHVLLLPHAVCLRDLFIQIAQQRERQALLLFKAGLRFRAVRRNADHRRAFLFELLDGIAKLAGFDGATRSAGSRVKIQDNLLAAQALQIERLARIALYMNLRSLIAFVQHSFLFNKSLTTPGFACPREAFIAWPTRKPSTVVL